MKNKKKIYLVSSGTGGHAAPILLLYKKLLNVPKLEVEILHSGTKIERDLFRGTKSRKIISAKFDRNSFLKKTISYPIIFAGLLQAKALLIFKRPDMIFSKGGYGAVPVLLVARILKIPYFLHESDSHMGLANKAFTDKAKKVFLGFPNDIYDQDFSDKKYQYVGQIVGVFPKIKKNSRKTIYITGGSQGAESINKIIYKIVDKLIKEYSIFHQVGDNNTEGAKKIKNGLGENAKNYNFFGFSTDKAKEATSKADLIIARAGANTIGEIAINKKASILIPYPYAASDHQTKNAKYLEKTGSAIIINQGQLSENSLLERIEYLLGNMSNSKILGEKIGKAIKTDGLKSVAEVIINSIKD